MERAHQRSSRSPSEVLSGAIANGFIDVFNSRRLARVERLLSLFARQGRLLEHPEKA
jgi:hypothetical protein